MNAPLFVLARLLRPSAVRAIHSISTGYAGFLGATISSDEIPFILTEQDLHEGTQDRSSQGDRNCDQNDDVCNTLTMRWATSRTLDQIDEEIGRMAYAHASPIVSLYEGNRLRQIADGAKPEKRCYSQWDQRAALSGGARKATRRYPPIFGSIGRVVPIRDIKIFIRTCESLPMSGSMHKAGLSFGR